MPQRKLLILDLDETLIYGTATALHDRPAEFNVAHFSLYRRPHLQAFLASAAELFDLAVWSSASGDYVNGVVAGVFQDPAALKFVWSCDRCTRRYDPDTYEHFWLKDLGKVRRKGYSLEQVVMLDDSPEKLSRHYGNHVQVSPYTGDPADEELRRVLPFLQWLRDVENVRTVEKRFWKEKRWPSV